MIRLLIAIRMTISRRILIQGIKDLTSCCSKIAFPTILEDIPLKTKNPERKSLCCVNSNLSRYILALEEVSPNNRYFGLRSLQVYY